MPMPEAYRSPVDILLAEDTAAEAEMTLLALSRAGIGRSILWVKDGKEAIDFIFCQGAYADRIPCVPPKLLLLDLNMPRLSGVDVLRIVKADPRTRSIPAVIMTSSSAESDMTSCYEVGANSYLVKPVGFSEYSEQVSTLGLYWLGVNAVPAARERL